MTIQLSKTIKAGLLGLASAALISGAAIAGGSIKDGPAAPASDWAISYNLGVTSDYVFRGFSQTAEKPTVQAGADLTYKIFYAGVWASGVDFGPITDAWAEIDYYAGIKPKFGPLTFDIGVIYYTYPRAFDPGVELDYVELKFGVSGEFWKDGTLGFTAFYSPEYTGKTGEVLTLEGSVSQVLPKFHTITPTFSALLGYQIGDTLAYRAAFGNGDDNYMYWNVGLSLGFHEKFSIDLRYWDTNLGDGAFCNGQLFQCGERFVATAKFTY